MEDNNRSLLPEQIHSKPHISNGDSDHHTEKSSSGVMGHVSGFIRRLLPHKGSPKIQKIHEGGSFREGLSVRSASHGSFSLGQNFQQNGVWRTMKIVRQNQIHIHAYFDNWLIKNYNPNTLVQQTNWVINLCRHLGWMINIQKSELVPTQQMVFVGHRLQIEPRVWLELQ